MRKFIVKLIVLKILNKPFNSYHQLESWSVYFRFFFVCFVITIIIVSIAPEYIEDENGNLIPKKTKLKNQQKQKK